MPYDDSNTYKPVPYDDINAYNPVPYDINAYKPMDNNMDDDYVKIDNALNNEDANIKIKKLEDDIKNVIDDRIKLLTIIDTITTDNRNMYRYIKKNDNGSWFSRLFR
jgi:hypothetical protein